jgi:hypothetical protein
MEDVTGALEQFPTSLDGVRDSLEKLNINIL